MLKELDIDFDLTEEFSLKKSSTCSPDLSRVNTSGNIVLLKIIKFAI